jgi:hypothetical protein
MASTSAGPKGGLLQGGDLGFEQFALEQHLAEPRLQPFAFESSPSAGREARLASPAARKASRQPSASPR